MQTPATSFECFTDTLVDEFERLDLDVQKAREWFDRSKFQIDIKLNCYSDDVRRIWLNEIFSHDILCSEMTNRVIEISKEFRDLAKELNEINGFFFRETIFGLTKYCYESTGNWIDPVRRDNVYRFAWFHFVMANELDSAFHSWRKGETGKFLLMSCPPQSGKSSLFSGALPAMILGNHPASKGVLGTYNANYAASVLRKDFMHLVSTSGYVKWFGKRFNKNLTPAEKKQFAASGITLPLDNSQIKETTSGGRIFGGSLKQLTGNPAQFILIDDPIPNAEVARSETNIRKITQEYDASAMSRVRNNTLIAVVQTRWSNGDVIGHTERKVNQIKEIEGEFDREVVNICFRAFNDSTDDFPYDFRKNHDQMLWAEVSSTAYLNAKYSDDVVTWNSVYQQKPISDSISLVKKEWIKMIPEDDIPFDFEDIVISVDTSYNDKKSSDKAALGVFGITKKGEYYLIDLIYERLSFMDCVDKLDSLIKTYIDYSAILIELKANGQAVYETLEKKYSRIIAIDATESKKARLLSISPVIQSGKLMLPDNRMGLDMLSQLVSFTGEGKHEKDDLVDISVQLIRWYDEQFKFKVSVSDVSSLDLSNRNDSGTEFNFHSKTNSGESLINRLKTRYNSLNKNRVNQICRL